jgi:glycosyltransferase involved in cell wall biosynthesis
VSSVERVKISVLIPVRNEARNLGRCLAPIVDWADEIVVVDSRSTDGTVEIAERAGARVLQFQYAGGWPKKRQWAIDTHPWRNDWILLLDADEILTEEAKRDIAQAIQSTTTNGYWLCFRMVFLGKMLRFGDTALWKLFLFRRGFGHYEKRLENQDASMADIEIHEHVVVEGPTGRIHSPIRHENWNSLDRYITKHNEYSNWESRVYVEGTTVGVQPNLFGNQAQRRRWLKSVLMRLPGSALWRFLYLYVFKLGFLDGRPGLIHAMFKFTQTFHVKAKIFELTRVSTAEPTDSTR